MTTNPEHYINRELSWLEFNQRVLDLAEIEEIPLLERVKFLAISGSNLDEFFKVRVGGLRIAEENEVHQEDLTGLDAREQLMAISSRVREMNGCQSEILQNLFGRLKAVGVRRLAMNELDTNQLAAAERCFDEEVCSVIGPIAIERGQPFPLLAGARLCICAQIRNASGETMGAVDESTTEERFVVLPVGNSFRRIVTLPDLKSGFSFVLLEDVIGWFLHKLFPGQEVLNWTTFRITRNADIVLNEDTMNDLLSEMTQLLDARKVSKIVRLEVDSNVTNSSLDFLVAATGASGDMVFKSDAALDLASFFELSSMRGFAELKDQPWPPQPTIEFTEGENVFDAIASQDRVLIHPYHHFDPVVDFLRAAASDPNVMAIKQTLYRTSKNSEIVEALVEAANNGKQVTAIVELKARFDEARNIKGAKQLEQAGIDVIYGVQGLKTHAKVCIVVRRESRGIQRYMHFGTGNYNEATAKLYSDISYFTNNEKLGYDAVLFFNAVTGLSVPQPLKALSAAPINLRDTLVDFIQAEIGNARQGGGCEINAKLNSLVDKRIIDALYAASQAGVKIRLNIRGICCLKPGVPGLSENIEVVSIVDRFLEHARIVHFHHGGDDRVFISSADWMGRNLNRRAELLVPIEDAECRQKLLRLLKAYFRDTVRARVLQSDGSYVSRESSDPPFRVQEYLYQQACDAYSAFANPKATVFKALRGESA